MRLIELEDFVSVARAGSFGKAAERTETPKSTISKRIRDLESSLGHRLFERTTRKIRLTSEGQLLLERAERLLGEAQDLKRLIRDQERTPRGLLRVGMRVLFGQVFAGQLAAAYTRRWPAVNVEIVIADRPFDLFEENLDCAITVGPLPDSSLIARRIASAEIFAVATRRILSSCSRPTRPKELSKLPQIGFRRGASGPVWSFRRGDEVEEYAGDPFLWIENISAIYSAVQEHAGWAFLPEFLVGEQLADGSLVRILEDWEGPQLDISVVYPERRFLSMRVQAFLELVDESFPGRTLAESVLIGP